MTALALALLGFAVLAASWLNLVLERAPLSLPMLAVGAGWALARLAGSTQFAFVHRNLIHDVVTLVLVAAVMGAGLAIDRPFGLRGWGGTWRLLGIAMLISALGIVVGVCWTLDFPIGIAILLAGILAPTDPVLARAVQVGPPGSGEEGEARFALTSRPGSMVGSPFPSSCSASPSSSTLRRTPGPISPLPGWFGIWLGRSSRRSSWASHWARV
ncbi:hypothetical protein [Paracraurococcus lichenis]|uniref:Cation/H+ exchanger domain-containing protein n=1 Tax=Paracraurococcus lichenis TaxID=3064888 RepID=A0ABT9ECK7_9PROT|nr:hypothetical protein [Paracraurococcus sp. LOR1-02]MDO9713957.1 hypothetical protein [Paracraurococcus sp. LOR1-02]